MLCVAGIDGYFKALNPAWTRVLGYAQEELLSRPYIDFVHPDDRAMTAAEASNIAEGCPTPHFRNRYRCVDGSYRWLSWTATAALLDGVIYASARDVTTTVQTEEGVRAERQRADASRQSPEALAGALLAGLIPAARAARVQPVEALRESL